MESRLLFVYGTRPEAIKLAPMLYECRERPGVLPIVCVTGQHRGLLDQSHEALHVKPDIDLALLQEGESLEAFCCRAIAALTPVIAREQPDVVIVQGDTTSALVASLVAFWAGIPIAHVEAGLRSHDPLAPFPEEKHRALIDQLARWHFAPTALARLNLLAEGISPDGIEVTGNTSIDALRLVRDHIPPLDALTACGISLSPGEKLVVATAHRRENQGERLADICRGIRDLAANHRDLRVCFVVHPNPAVEGAVRTMLFGHPRIDLVEGLPYDCFIALLRSAWLLLTDSGGLQEEASALGIPVLVLRETTERMEAVDAGRAILVGSNPDRLLAAVDALASNPAQYRSMREGGSLFGDGYAARRIVSRLLTDLRKKP